MLTVDEFLLTLESSLNKIGMKILKLLRSHETLFDLILEVVLVHARNKS